MSFSDKNNSNKPPKRQSIIGWMFNPRLGDGIRPLGESTRVFINLIALIFAINGLFPKNHPALRNELGARLTLSEVIETAWRQLSFTKEGIPKVILFLAVVGGLLCGLLSLLILLLGLFVGQANAQTFTPANPNTDIGFNIIDFLFGAADGGAKSAAGFSNLQTTYGNMLQYTNTAGNTVRPTLPDVGLEAGLWAALGFYSNAMLIFAAIILGYHLVAMILDTAHSGVAMGKRTNQIWAPIRLAVAIILLVPVNGMNAGQLLIMQVAQWGSGMASMAWATFKTNLGNNSTTLGSLVSKDISDKVLDMASIGACQYSVNYNKYKESLGTSGMFTASPESYINGWNNGFDGSSPWDASSDPILPGDWYSGLEDPSWAEQVTDDEDGGWTYHFQPLLTAPGDEDYCGSFRIPPEPSYTDPAIDTVAKGIWSAHFNSFMTMATKAMTYARYNTPQFLDTTLTSGNTVESGGTTISSIVKDYQTDLNNQLSAMATTNIALTDRYASLGWVAAGAYFHKTATVSGSLKSEASQNAPKVNGKNTNDAFRQWMYSVYGQQTTQSISNARRSGAVSGAASGGGGCRRGGGSIDFAETAKEYANMFLKEEHLSNAVLKVLDKEAGRWGVWCPGEGLKGVTFNGSGGTTASGRAVTDVLGQIAGWGHNNMELALTLFDYGILFNLLGGIASDTWARVALGVVGLGAAVASTASGTAAVSDPNKSWWSKAWDSTVSAVKSGASTVVAKVGDTLGLTELTGFYQKLNWGKVAAFTGLAALLGPGLAVIGSAFVVLGSIFFGIGVTFGFFIPLIPFIQFLLATIAWVALLFEAVIAMPLVALAHITPEGEGISGPQAKGAYQMAFSLLLRPAMMVFGLICAYICLALAVSILNLLYAGAVGDSGSGSGRTVAYKIVGTVVYVSIITIVANHAFQLINKLPDSVMKWMGASSASAMSMGDPSGMEQKIAAGSAIVSNRVMGGAAAGAKGVGAWGGDRFGKEMRHLQDAKEGSKTDKETARGTQDAMKNANMGSDKTQPNDGGGSAGGESGGGSAGGSSGGGSSGGGGSGGNMGGGGNAANMASSTGDRGDGTSRTPPQKGFSGHYKDSRSKGLHDWLRYNGKEGPARASTTARQTAFDRQTALNAGKAQHSEMIAALQNRGGGGSSGGGAGDSADSGDTGSRGNEGEPIGEMNERPQQESASSPTQWADANGSNIPAAERKAAAQKTDANAAAKEKNKGSIDWADPNFTPDKK